MLGIRVTIVRYISDEPQPGIVECQFEDAHGHRWSFVEKTAYVSIRNLDAQSKYPQEGVLACEIVQHSLDRAGREVIRIDTEHPSHIESVEGETKFDVLPESLIEFNWRKIASLTMLTLSSTFPSTLQHALGEERHFALVGISCHTNPRLARNRFRSGVSIRPMHLFDHNFDHDY